MAATPQQQEPFASSGSGDGPTTNTTMISSLLDADNQVSDNPHHLMETPIRRTLLRPTNPLDPPSSGSQASESPLLVSVSPSLALSSSPIPPPPPLRLFEQTPVAPLSTLPSTVDDSTTTTITTISPNPLAAELSLLASSSNSISILGPRSDSLVGTAPTPLEKQRINLRESALSVVEVHPVCPKCRLEIRPSMEVSCVLPSSTEGETAENPSGETVVKSDNREEVKLELAFRVLRCGHAFCDRCIETMHEDQTIFCWTCDLDTPLPTNDIRDLPKNFILNDIAQGPMPKQVFLDRMATCPICCEMYNETHLPRVLLCGHTFCGHCISECVVSNQLKIRCPYKCHVLTPLVNDEEDEERRGSADRPSSNVAPSSVMTGDITPPVNAGLLTQLMFAPALADMFRSIPTHIMPFPDPPFLADSVVSDPSRPLPPIYARFRPKPRPKSKPEDGAAPRTTNQATQNGQPDSFDVMVRVYVGYLRFVQLPMTLGVGGYSLWLFARFQNEACEKPLAPWFLALACLLFVTLVTMLIMECFYHLNEMSGRDDLFLVFFANFLICVSVNYLSIGLFIAGVTFSFQLPTGYHCPRILVISTRVLSLFYLVPVTLYCCLVSLLMGNELYECVTKWRQRRRQNRAIST